MARTGRTAGLLLVALLLSASTARAEIVDRIAAVVDREVITLSGAEQAAEFRRLRGEEELSMGEVVERLIEARLVEREVSRYPEESVSQDRIDEVIESIRRSFSSEPMFVESLNEQGMTQVELESLIRKQMTTERYLERRFRPLVYITDEDVSRYYEEELVPVLETAGESAPPLENVDGSIRRILQEKAFNERVDTWIDDLKSRAQVRRYVW